MRNKYIFLLKNTLIFALGNLGAKLVLFLLVPLYTHYLSTEEYGIADLIFAYSEVLIPIITLCIYHAVLRFGLSKKYKVEDVLVSSLPVYFIGSTILGLFLFIFQVQTSISQWKWLLFCSVLINSLSSILMNYLKVLSKNKDFAIIGILQAFCLAIANIVSLAILELGVTGYLWSHVIAASCAVLLAIYKSNILRAIRIGQSNKKLLIEMIRYSTPLIVNDLSWLIIYSSDKFMIEYELGAHTLGLYVVATKLLAFMNVLISIFSHSWTLSAILEKESTNDSKFYAEIFTPYFFITSFICLMLTAFSDFVIEIYVSDAYYESAKFLPFLFCGAVLNSVSSYFGILLNAFNRTLVVMLTTITGCLLHVFLNYILLQKFEVWGILVSILITYFFMAITRYLYTQTISNFRINFVKVFMSISLVICHAILITINGANLIASIATIFFYTTLNLSLILKFRSHLFAFIKKK